MKSTSNSPRPVVSGTFFKAIRSHKIYVDISLGILFSQKLSSQIERVSPQSEVSETWLFCNFNRGHL